MKSILYTIVVRHLRHSEQLLAESDSALAREAYRNVHEARKNIEVLLRVEEQAVRNREAA